MAETLSTISMISFVLAAVLFILAIVLWFYFRIPRIIGDLSGRTARKSIEKMRAHNEKSGNRGYIPSAINAKRGKLTDTMSGSKKLAAEPPAPAENPAPSEPMPPAPAAAETEALPIRQPSRQNSAQTEQLSSVATFDPSDPNETEFLATSSAPPVPQGNFVPLKMLDEVILIHTQEVI